jgi:hypothetical protein
MCKGHFFTVQRLVKEVGNELGTIRTYEDTADTLEGRSCPGWPRWIGLEDQLLMQQCRAPHTIYFADDPEINETNRLIWTNGNNTIMRVISIPKNTHGSDRLWSVLADSMSLDQVTKAIQ